MHQEIACLGIALLISTLYASMGWKEKANAPILIVWLLSLQNLMIGVGAHVSGNDSGDLIWLTQIPFAVTGVLFVSVILDRMNKPMVDRINKYFILLAIWIAVMFLLGVGSLAARLVSVRNATVFFMAFCIAREYLKEDSERERFYFQFGICCVIVSVAGIVLMTQDVAFWMNMGLSEVYIAKQSPISLTTEWGHRFVTSVDGIHNVVRMMSTYYEPVNLAYLLSAGLICIGLTWKKGVPKYLALLIVALGLFLTFGKGGWMVAGVFVLFLLFYKSSTKRKTDEHGLRRPLVILGIILTGASLAAILYFLFVGGAVRPHFWAVINTWENVISRPVGHGLGSGGNAAYAFNSALGEWLSTGEESALMSFMYQIGIPGVLLLLLTMIAFCKTSRSILPSSKGAALFSLPIILLAVSLLQDNTFAPQCIIPFMFLLGSISAEAKDASRLSDINSTSGEVFKAIPCRAGTAQTIGSAEGGFRLRERQYK